MTTPYPSYDVLAKWETPSFDALTQGVLRKRLDEVPEPCVFNADEFRLLEALCARLVPQPDRAAPVPIAPWIDADIAANRGEGFRDPAMPAPREAWRRGLAGINAEARRRHARPFADLEPGDQDATLRAVQAGQADADGFAGVSPTAFFTDILLKTAVGIYYSHPAAWSEIGFGGPASPRGYVRIGPNERDPWEAPLAAAPGEDR